MDDRYPLMLTKRASPTVRVVVQPISTHRFRYKSEGRWAGSIPGANKKSYPTIEISGCSSGTAIIVISCVTKDPPYKTHPHSVMARHLYESEDEVKRGVFTTEVQLSGASTLVAIKNIGIHSCKHNEIKKMLALRKRHGVDPFKNGFNYGNKPKSIDLNAVRLCFQVFIVDENDRLQFTLRPVVSNVIHDKKIMGELNIVHASHCTGPALGGTEVVLLCKKVKPTDIAVMFFEKVDEQVVWVNMVTDLFVHQKVAIVFKTPPYRDPKFSAKVYMQLKRLSDNARSQAVDFQYTAASKDAPSPIPSRPEHVYCDCVRMSTKPIQRFPIDMHLFHGPQQHQVQHPQDVSWVDPHYVLLEEHLHHPNIQPPPRHVPHLPLDHSASYQRNGYPQVRLDHPFTRHRQEQYIGDENLVRIASRQSRHYCCRQTGPKMYHSYPRDNKH